MASSPGGERRGGATGEIAVRSVRNMGGQEAGEFVAETVSGPVVGVRVAPGAIRFAGIPYARAPVGALRFLPPQPPEAWREVRDARAFGPSAIQPLDAHEPASLVAQGEDCLRVSVWTPGVDAARRPVLVFIHGGGYYGGGSHDASYDGARFAERGDVVLVTIQYRLGPLGWLDLEALGGAAYRQSKNAGLLDQRLALAWVRDNIARFGGDPGNVTIFGESAGGSSVTTLLLMPEARGLFHKVIAQSGTFEYRSSAARARQTAREFLARTGVNDLEGLVGLSADAVRQATDALTQAAELRSDWLFGPVYDGELLPEDPYASIAAGSTRGIPLLHGTTADEYHYWLLYFRDLMQQRPRASLGRLLTEAIGVPEAALPALLELLGELDPEATELERYLRAATLEYFRWPHARLAEAQRRHAPTWLYRFDWSNPAQPELGAYHGLELPFVFYNLSDEGLGDAPEALGDRMQDAWVAFARHGDPNHPGLPHWPRFDGERNEMLVFDAAPRLAPDPERGLRERWDAVRSGRSAP
jgi:para-nitrobenzyl esterase